MTDPKEPIKYRFTPQFDGAHLKGIPPRDLTQSDVDRLDPGQQRDAFSDHPGYGTPLYTPVEHKAHDKTADKGAEKGDDA